MSKTSNETRTKSDTEKAIDDAIQNLQLAKSYARRGNDKYAQNLMNAVSGAIITFMVGVSHRKRIQREVAK